MLEVVGEKSNGIAIHTGRRREVSRAIVEQNGGVLQGQNESPASRGEKTERPSRCSTQGDRTVTPPGRTNQDGYVSLHPENALATPRTTLRDLVSSDECGESQVQSPYLQAPYIVNNSRSGSKRRRQQYGQDPDAARKSPRLGNDQECQKCQVERARTVFPSEICRHRNLPRKGSQDHHLPINTTSSSDQAMQYPSLTNPYELMRKPEPLITDLEQAHLSTSPPTQQVTAKFAPEYISLDCSDSEDPPQDLLPARPVPAPLPATEPELCEEQAKLVEIILSGANVHYTGSAGCGKSTVLKAFVKLLRDRNKLVKIIAPTGRAALDVDGMTFWTYAGWHPDSMKFPITVLEERARFQKYVNERLCETDVLVIDEISMFENHHFERLNRVMKFARNNTAKFSKEEAAANAKAPFGGVQLIVTGDFCQLPPVKPFTYCFECGRTLFACQNEESYTCLSHGEFLDVDKWAFRSKAWQECDFEHVNLKHIHRQSDQKFISILNKLRFGRKLSTEDRTLLLDHPCDTTNAVKLFPLVREVREINGLEFAKLKGPTLTFDCVDDYHWEPEHLSLSKNWQRNSDNSLKALDNHRFERRIQFKTHMLVVLLVNLDIKLGLVNGSQGIVLGFLEHNPAQIPEQTGQHADCKRTQIEKFINRAPVKKWPLVRFHNGVTRLIKARCAISELGESEPYSLIHRTQIPLLAAWAMTIHKSQGMTLSRVDVNISKVFEKGQGYVALSRATSLEGLNVRALGDCDQGGNEQVMEFLEEKFGRDVIEDMASCDAETDG